MVVAQIKPVIPEKDVPVKMPQCPIHRLFYPFGSECFYCVVEAFQVADMERE